MPRFTTTPEANRILLEGQIALSEIESYGVRVDVDYLNKVTLETKEKIREAEADLQADPNYQTWKRRFGERTNVASATQMSVVVFQELGHTAKIQTEKAGRASASKKALEDVDLPFVKKYIYAAELRKMLATYLDGIRREMVEQDDGWFIRPSYGLNNIVTFRSGCESINWQNIYKRDPEKAAIVRKCFVPRHGFQIGEIDYDSAEVKMAANYTLDPVAVKECNDPDADPHGDTAARLFFMTKKEAKHKPIRHVAKNGFVFAQFYGDYYINCARNMWSMLPGLTLDGSTETVIERLAKNGITSLGACDPKEPSQPGTFEAHVKTVEDWYWKEKYRVHAQWKRDWWDSYQRNGGIQTKTGYAINGVYSRNEVINQPIQCDAFQCTLWSLPRINQRLRRHKFRSRVIGEIHDAIQLDMHPKERDDVINICRSIMTTELTKAWPWLEPARPSVSPECCPVDRSWFDLAGLKEDGGKWIPAKLDDWVKKYGDWVLQY